MAVGESRLEVQVVLEALNAIKTAGQLEAVLNSIANKKWIANVSLKTVGADIDRLKASLKAIGTQKSEVQVDINKAQRKIERLKEEFENIRKQGIRPNVSKFTSDISKLQEEIASSEERMEELNQQGASFKLELRTAEELQKILQADKKELEGLGMVAKRALGFKKTGLNGNILRMQPLKDGIQTINMASASFKRLGQNVKQVGNGTLEVKASAYLLASAFRNIGNIMQRISRLNPFSNILSYQINMLTYSLNGALSEAFSGAIERYDKLKSANLTLMGLFGDSPKQVKKISSAIDELDKSVIGLPTTLDDIVDSAKQFISITGDVEKGTKMAIATNRAFLASGADSEQVYHGTKQLYDLMAAGKLRTQEWESLFKAMPLAMRKVGDEMGYTGDKFADFRTKLKSGEISAKDFMNTMIKLGYETDGSIYKLAENSKQMISSVLINWKTALKRGIANTITTFDEMSKELTGESLTTNLISVSKQIDEVFESLQNYIRENKDYFADWGETLKNFPIKEFIEGTARYVKILADLYKIQLKIFSSSPKILSFLTMSLKPIGAFTSSVLPTIFYTKAILRDYGGIAGIMGRMKLGNLLKGAKQTQQASTIMAKGATAMATSATAVEGTAVAVEGSAGTLLGSAFLMGEARVALGVAIADLTAVLTAWSAKTSASQIRKAIEELISGFDELKKFSGYTQIRMNIGRMMNVVEYLYSFISGNAGMEAMTNMSAGDKLKKEFNNINNAVRPLVEISSSMAEISASIKKTDVDALEFELSSAIETLNTILSDITTPDVDNANRTIDKSAIEIFKNRLKELSGAMSYAKSIASNISGTNWTNIGTKLQSAIDNMELAFSVLDENKLPITSTGTVNPTASTQTADTIYNRAEAFKKIVQAMNEATGSMKEIYESITELEDVNFKEAKDRLSKAIKNVVALMNIDDVKNLIPLASKGDKASDSVKKFNSLTANWKNLSDLLSSLTGKGGVITQISSIKGNLDKISSIKWKEAKTLLTKAIQNMLDLMKLDITDADGNEYDFEALTKNAENINLILSEIEPSIANIVKIKSSLSELKGEEGKINIGNTIKTLLSNLNTNMSEETITTLQNKATEMFTFANTMKSAMSTLKASVQGVKGKYGFSGLSSAIQDCIDKITELEKHTDIKIKVSLNDKISDKVDAIIGKLDALKAKSPVNVTVNLNQHTTTTQTDLLKRKRWNPLTKQWEYYHTGGLVKPLYRANGGSIFRPRGTDRVPAMLTQGEFVMKRSAVQKFGLEFMNKLNNMDISGALKSLSLNGGTTTHLQKNINTVHNDNRKDTKVTVNQYMKDSGLASFKAGKALRGI